MGERSAGLLMYRTSGETLEVFLAHPGGPYFRNKDLGSWGIPKGSPEGEEALEDAARREFFEETGLRSQGPYLDLGSVRLRSGKTIYAWAFEGTIPNGFVLQANSFTIEWPPRSGRMQAFPELDQGGFFPLAEAQEKIAPAQLPFIERLCKRLREDPAR